MDYFSDVITSPRTTLNDHYPFEEGIIERCRKQEPDWFSNILKRETPEPPWFNDLLRENPTFELVKPKIRDISQPKDSLISFEREKAAFLEMEKDLLKKYKGNFVAVLGQMVVDSDKDMQALMKRVYKGHGYVPVYVQKVGRRRVIKLRSPRLLRRR
ncbi:hypothetical protein KJ656_04490 [bacterium]|nr:hypothetical protein [bacterium]